MYDIRAHREGDSHSPDGLWHITATSSIVSLCSRRLSVAADAHPLAEPLSVAGVLCQRCKRELDRRRTEQG
jgi:hypothetical protein